jgi:hypothetical protein
VISANFWFLGASGLGCTDAGVVHEHLDEPVMVRDRVHGACDAGVVGYIANKIDMAGAQACGSFTGRLFIWRARMAVSAPSGGSFLCNGKADPRVSAVGARPASGFKPSASNRCGWKMKASMSVGSLSGPLSSEIESCAQPAICEKLRALAARSCSVAENRIVLPLADPMHIHVDKLFGLREWQRPVEQAPDLAEYAGVGREGERDQCYRGERVARRSCETAEREAQVIP